MTIDATTPFSRCRELVLEMAADGHPVTTMEGVIAETDLPADEKDALWLVGWVLADSEKVGPRMRLPGEGTNAR